LEFATQRYKIRGAGKIRKPSIKTPESLKEADYYEKRRRNNAAARKSRNAKNEANKRSFMKAKVEEEKNTWLNEKIGEEIVSMLKVKVLMHNNLNLRNRIFEAIHGQNFKFFSTILDLVKYENGKFSIPLLDN
jgi:hypothetical protein